MQVTKDQIRIISTLLRNLKWESQKGPIVSAFSNGRSESRSGLTQAEAQDLIVFLNKEAAKADSANQMRRKLIAKCHNMGWETAPGVADMERLNNWCKEKSYLKKELMQYTAAELPKLVSQFDLLYRKHLQKSSAND